MIEFRLGIPENERSSLGFAPNDEEYLIRLGEKSTVYAAKPNGFVFAVSTLEQLKASGELSELTLYDSPDRSIRGYRVFLPGRETIGEFMEMIDILAYCRARGIRVIPEEPTLSHSDYMLLCRPDLREQVGDVTPIGCADKLPRDITMLHWYWSFNPEYDKVYHETATVWSTATSDALSRTGASA